MGLGDKLAVGVGVAFLGAVVRDAYKNAQEAAKNSQETKRRKESPLRFDKGITQSEFVEMANLAAKRTPRLANVAVSGMTVTIQVRSNSGLSIWAAEVDYNDYGHLTGTYWIHTGNSRLDYPRALCAGPQVADRDSSYRGAFDVVPRDVGRRSAGTWPQMPVRPSAG